MILRKPYAFLIKHFRLIHFIIFTCMLYVLFKTWNIVDFFNGYISNGQVISTFEDISAIYVNNMFLVVVTFLIIVLAIVLYLMKHKKKPSLYYIISLCIYSILLLLLLFASSFIYNLQFTTPDLRVTKFVRDIFLLIFGSQIPLPILSFVRAIGFDFKKFDFKKDIMDLDISSEDNEEFEFEVNLDTEDIRAKIRKRFRYFKYYYKENKIIFYGLFIIVGIIIGINVHDYYSSKEQIFKEQEFFDTTSFQINVIDSYKTTVDTKGNKINSKNFYVILKMRYKNKTSIDRTINIDNARLSYSEFNSVAPTKMVYNKFTEFGVPYYTQSIKAGELRDFIFVYEIPIEFYDSDFTLKYLYGSEYVNNQVDYKYRTVDLDVSDFGEMGSEVVDTKNLGEELVFTNSVLGNTKLTITDIDFSNKYLYNVILCKTTGCNKSANFIIPSTNYTYDLTLMRVEYDLVYDNRLGTGYSVSDFIARFGRLRFVVNGKEYDHKLSLNDVTPYSTNRYAYIEVRSKMTSAEKIYLDFVVRDKKYTYVIYDKSKEEVEKEEEIIDETVEIEESK